MIQSEYKVQVKLQDAMLVSNRNGIICYSIDKNKLIFMLHLEKKILWV